MGWFEALKDFVNVRLKFGNSSFFTLNINSHNTTTENKAELDKKTLIIYPKNLSASDKKALEKILKEAENEEELLFDEEKSLILKNAVAYEDSGEDDLILKFYKGEIPPLDYKALEQSLFLRSEFKAKRQIAGFKLEISNKYGARGNNIANLCSANYFEELIKVHNEYGLEVFKKTYELLVGQGIYALFIHYAMKAVDIEKEIKRNIQACKDYDIPGFRVHGIGKENIKKIKTAIKSLKSSGTPGFLDKITINEAIITVEIIM